MSIYGDAEPEDAWHPDDPLDVLVDNLCRRCNLLGEPRRLGPDATLAQQVAELAERLARASVRDLNPRDRVRVAGINQDLSYVNRRLIREG